DPRADLAVLRVKDDGKERFPVIDFGNSDDLQVGDVVLAVGNPFGVGQTVTHGIVSAVARTQVGISDYQFFIQTDAAINPGNSGGALVDLSGRLVGINTAIFSRSGGSQGIGFAIPAHMVKVVVASARAGKETTVAVALEPLPDTPRDELIIAARSPFQGAKVSNLSPALADELKLDPLTDGVVVTAVADGSLAQNLGFIRGDLVISVNNQKIVKTRDLQRASSQQSRVWRLTITRG